MGLIITKAKLCIPFIGTLNILDDYCFSYMLTWYISHIFLGPMLKDTSSNPILKAPLVIPFYFHKTFLL